MLRGRASTPRDGHANICRSNHGLGGRGAWNACEPASASGWRSVSRVAHEINDLVRAIGRPPGIIDDVFDGADSAQGDSEEIMELDSRGIGDLEGVGVDDARVDLEEAVGPNPRPWWDLTSSATL